VLAAARPLSEVLWMRETAASPLDTPERRAAMERRLREAVARIGDPLARRYYEADIAQRLDAMTPRWPQAGRSYRQGERGFSRERHRPSNDRRSWGGPEGRWQAPLAPSPVLASAPTFSGTSPGLAQEALIVLGLDARRDLLAELAEDLSSLAFSDPDALALARALLDDHAFEAERQGGGPASIATDLDARRARLRRKLRPGDGRFLAPHGVPAELEAELRQAIGLHDRSRALRSELRDAERALGAEATEASLAWLSDVHVRLAALQQMPASSDGEGGGGRTLEQAIAEAPTRRR
jgi:DNA primase